MCGDPDVGSGVRQIQETAAQNHLVKRRRDWMRWEAPGGSLSSLSSAPHHHCPNPSFSKPRLRSQGRGGVQT